MGQIGSFGDWVRRRRKILDMTQADLAGLVSVSLSMLRKIESDERRPSEQLAGLLADRLVIDDAQRKSFLQMARGRFVADIPDPGQAKAIFAPPLYEAAEQDRERAPFVARERQLHLLHEHLNAALQGQGRMVFVAGEAGRGKTSLLAEFARQALDARPHLIFAGGASDVYTGQGDPLLPFRDIFRLLTGDFENARMPAMITRGLTTRLAQAAPDIIEILLETGPHLIGTLLPEAALEARLARSFPHHPKSAQLLLHLQDQLARRAPSGQPEFRQDRLFDEISTTLKALAQRWPFVLVLDDLHWIDQSSAALLGHLLMRLRHSPILIVGAYRPEDLAHLEPVDRRAGQAQHPLEEVLSESLRQFGQNRLDLDRSEPGEELGFVNALLDVDDNAFSTEFREHMTRQTEGHPLFVVELLRDMRERGDIIRREDGLWQERGSMIWENFPARVEGVIEKRIKRLPVDLRGLLSAASVQGETFFAEVIVQVTQSSPRELARRMGEELDRQHLLISAQGVRRAGAERLSQYRFRHHLFQRYVYERLSAAERMYLHEAVGNTLEALLASSPDPDGVPATQLARHFQEAHLSEKAGRYLLRAGQQAARVLAHDEAATYFERGLELLETLPRTPANQRLEYELRLALGRALWYDGRVAESMTACYQAIEIARGLADPHALARAALAYEEPRWRLNLDPGLSQQIMRESLAAFTDEDSGLSVRLLVHLARSLLNAGDHGELRVTVDRALDLARRSDDPQALIDALRIKAQVDRRPESTALRHADVQEMIALAESIGDKERLADGIDLSIYDLLELGQIEQVDRMIAVQRRLAHETRHLFQMHVAAVFQTMRAILRGEFEEAERLAYEAADLSQQIGVAEMDGILGMHMFTIRREQGRIHEVAPILKLVVDQNPGSSAWRPGLALIYQTLGRRVECQAIFEDLAVDGFASIAQDSLRVATLAYLTEVCVYLGDADRAATLYQFLLPYAGRTVVVGGATACYGAVARYLGMLAAARSDWETAERHFAEAVTLDAHMNALPWLAHSQGEYAAMLLERGCDGDRERAIPLLAEASNAARRMGMACLAQKITDLRARFYLNMGENHH